jgi:hypothetical protein
MSNLPFTSNHLKSGRCFYYSNEAYQKKIQEDDIRVASIFYSTSLRCYILEFNGAFILTSSYLQSIKRRLKKLITKWHLERYYTYAVIDRNGLLQVISEEDELPTDKIIDRSIERYDAQQYLSFLL